MVIVDPEHRPRPVTGTVLRDVEVGGARCDVRVAGRTVAAIAAHVVPHPADDVVTGDANSVEIGLDSLFDLEQLRQVGCGGLKSPSRTLEALVLGVALVAILVGIFDGRLPPQSAFSHPMVIFPILIWARCASASAAQR